MRMRRKKHREERMEACSELLIPDILEYKNDIKSVFADSKPLYIEIGCGKGKFITETATNNPDVNFIAIEKISDVIVLALEKVKAAGLTNVKFVRGDANLLGEFETESKCDRIYINFCDPWKKSGYAKRRLTHANFLEKYKGILKPGGEIHFKTDNRGLFDFSLEEFKEFGMRMEKLTFDLHNSEYMDGNVMTEYEKRFSSLGVPINRVECYFE